MSESILAPLHLASLFFVHDSTLIFKFASIMIIAYLSSQTSLLLDSQISPSNGLTTFYTNISVWEQLFQIYCSLQNFTLLLHLLHFNIFYLLFISATIEGILLIAPPHLTIPSDMWRKTAVQKRSRIAATWKQLNLEESVTTQ